MSKDLLNSERPKNIDALAMEQYELLLEEQAFPFEEKAIAIHESNTKRSAEGIYDDWVKRSFSSLGQLLPARYKKEEVLQLVDGETRSIQVNPFSVDNESDSETGSEQLIQEEQWYRQQMRRNSNDLVLYNQLAIFLREQGRFREAKDVYLHALSVRNTDALTHRNLGILYDLYLREPNSALRHFREYQLQTGGTDRSVQGWIADLERQVVVAAQEEQL